jgi:hypothetical protein
MYNTLINYRFLDSSESNEDISVEEEYSKNYSNTSHDEGQEKRKEVNLTT